MIVMVHGLVADIKNWTLSAFHQGNLELDDQINPSADTIKAHESYRAIMAQLAEAEYDANLTNEIKGNINIPDTWETVSTVNTSRHDGWQKTVLTALILAIVAIGLLTGFEFIPFMIGAIAVAVCVIALVAIMFAEPFVTETKETTAGKEAIDHKTFTNYSELKTGIETYIQEAAKERVSELMASQKVQVTQV